MCAAWQGSIFLMTWILLEVVCALKHKTACYTFPLIVDPPCGATEMLLPTMFTLGVSSDVTCHSEITGVSLRQKGVDEIRRCCQQRENDAVTEYCLPAMKNQLRDHYYRDFVNICSASTLCQLSSPGGMVQHTDGEDYVTFTFDCVHKDTVLHIQQDSTHTGQEVYLYNDQHDGEAHANCIAYSHGCDSHVIIQLAATRVVSPACQVIFTDGVVSINKMDCKNPPASNNCSSTMFESKSNYVNMSIFMTTDPGRREKEFLWIRAKADTGKNVTVVCGANIPADVSLNCPKSTSTTTTTTTTTTAAAPTTTTSQTPVRTQKPVVVTPSIGNSQVMQQSTMTTSSKTSIRNNAATTLPVYKKTPVTSAATTAQTPPSSTMTSTRTTASQSHNSNSPLTQQQCGCTQPTSLTCDPSNTLPITLGVSIATLFVGLVLGWIMTRCYDKRETRKNDAVVYDTTSTMNDEHAYSTVQPTSTATYANTSYEYYNQ